MTSEGDVVLVQVEDSPLFFGRVESITPDVKPGWFHLKLLVLQVPLVVVTWILKRDYFNGAEFTMGGRRMRIERVVAPDQEDAATAGKVEEETGSQDILVPPATREKGKVVSFSDRRKKDVEKR